MADPGPPPRQGEDEEEDGYIELDAPKIAQSSIGNAASLQRRGLTFQEHKARKPGSMSQFRGAGIVPVTRQNGQVYCLLQQPQRGKRGGIRWFDFGGKKLGSDELMLECACRKFAKQTYGLFGVDADWEADPVFYHVEELYQGERKSVPRRRPQKVRIGSAPPVEPPRSARLSELAPNVPGLDLLRRGGKLWSTQQLLSDDNLPQIFYHHQLEYFVILMQVPYISHDLLDEASAICDGGKRSFLWFRPEEFANEALAGRLHIDGLLRAMQVLHADDYALADNCSYGEGPIVKPYASFAVEVHDP